MDGVIYYNKGSKCLTRLLVSLYSVRKHYTGAVNVLCDGDLPEWVLAELVRLNADITPLPAEDFRPLVRKAQLWKYTPFEKTVFLDADTLPVADISPLFAEIDKQGFFTYHFAGWQTTGGTVSKRIRAWEPATSTADVEAAVKYGKAVNTGLFGFRKGHPLLPEWEKLTLRGYAKNCTRRLVDELACQMLLPKHPHTLVGPEWGASVKFSDVDGAKIFHYHGNKNALDWDACGIWKQAYWDYRNTSPVYEELGANLGEKRMRRYIKAVVKPDITIVTACSGKYVDKLRDNWPKWMAMEGIREQQFIVFWRGRRPDFLDEYRNVRLVKWRFRRDLPDMTERERMLSAFVFGTARRVKTPFWLKLDADATPKQSVFKWPNYAENAITAHRWGYTRVKGDPKAQLHWLNWLDCWYD